MAPLQRKRQVPEDTTDAAEIDNERPPHKRSMMSVESVVERSRRHYNNLRVVLEKTISGRYRNGGSNYDNVGVLLICWEHDDLQSLGKEIQRLGDIFKNRFRFEVEVFRIPSEKTVTSLNHKVSQFALRYDSPSDLAILYYGGHGAREDSRLRLYARHKPNGEGNPSAFFEDVVYALHHCDTDVLVITDCCYAALAFTEKEVGKRKFELLTATGPEQKSYAPQSPRSFTRHLCETLEELVDTEGGFTTSKLYRKLYFKADPEFKPFLFDQSSQDWGRISLKPLKPLKQSVASSDAMDVDKPRRPYNNSGDTVLHMELRLRSKPKPHNMNELARAMQYLPYVKEIKFKRMYAPRVELEGFMSGVVQAIKIRPFVTRLRKRIEERRAAQGRSIMTQVNGILDAESSGVRSPRHPSHIYNWNESRLLDEGEESADASNTPPPVTAFPLEPDLLIADYKDANPVTAVVVDGEAVEAPRDSMQPEQQE